MSPYFPAAPNRRTASFTQHADVLSQDVRSLGAHLDTCQGQRGRLFTLHCLAEAMHGALASRFVTTLVGIALLFAAASLAA